MRAPMTHPSESEMILIAKGVLCVINRHQMGLANTQPAFKNDRENPEAQSQPPEGDPWGSGDIKRSQQQTNEGED